MKKEKRATLGGNKSQEYASSGLCFVRSGNRPVIIVCGKLPSGVVLLSISSKSIVSKDWLRGHRVSWYCMERRRTNGGSSSGTQPLGQQLAIVVGGGESFLRVPAGWPVGAPCRNVRDLPLSHVIILSVVLPVVVALLIFLQNAITWLSSLEAKL